jgi:hypothetical protein
MDFAERYEFKPVLPRLSLVGNLEKSHCNKNPIYVFPEKELRCGLSPSSYIHVSVSNFYIPRICRHSWLQQNRQTDPGKI